MKPLSLTKVVGLALIVVVVLVLAGWLALTHFKPALANQQEFNGARALRDVEYQVALGPRTPGSSAHTQTVQWIVGELLQAGWDVSIQETQMMAHPVRNIIARWGKERPWVVVGAHYDSRLAADRDPDPANRGTPLPGANDGASGVAILLELGRVLPSYARLRQSTPGVTGVGSAQESGEEQQAGQVWLVFFDVEDNGKLPGWDWILGSQAFVTEYLDPTGELPDAAVVVDMVGDADLKIYQEKNSDPVLSEQIWKRAATLGYGKQFVPQPKYGILDDHLPFIQAGIPAVDIIDFDYPYWHTLSDTPDKLSASSLEVVGNVVLHWLVSDVLKW